MSVSTLDQAVIDEVNAPNLLTACRCTLARISDYSLEPEIEQILEDLALRQDDHTATERDMFQSINRFLDQRLEQKQRTAQLIRRIDQEDRSIESEPSSQSLFDLDSSFVSELKVTLEQIGNLTIEPTISERMQDLGDRVSTLTGLERDELLRWIRFWENRLLEQFAARVTLKRFARESSELVTRT